MIATLISVLLCFAPAAPRPEARSAPKSPAANAMPAPAGDSCQPYWENVSGPGNLLARVEALAVYDDGSGPALYAGGIFRRIGNVSAQNLARYDGTAWSGEGLNISGSHGLICFPIPGCFPAGPHVYSLATYSDGQAEHLLVGGNFTSAAGRRAGSIAAYDGESFNTLQGGVKSKIYRFPQSAGLAGADVYDVAPAAVNGQPGFVAGGHFRGPAPIAAFDGQRWQETAPLRNLSGHFLSVVEFDDGDGPAIYAGGRLEDADTYESLGLLKWDGSTWTNVPDTTGHFANLVVFDDGQGPALYAEGAFFDENDEVIGGIIRLRAGQWSRLETKWNVVAYTLAVLDDGSGPALFVAGRIYAADSSIIHPLAKWSGQEWIVFPTGPWSGPDPYAVAVFDDGSGPAIYIGGIFISEEPENLGTVFRLRQPEGPCP